MDKDRPLPGRLGTDPGEAAQPLEPGTAERNFPAAGQGIKE